MSVHTWQWCCYCYMHLHADVCSTCTKQCLCRCKKIIRGWFNPWWVISVPVSPHPGPGHGKPLNFCHDSVLFAQGSNKAWIYYSSYSITWTQWTIHEYSQISTPCLAQRQESMIIGSVPCLLWHKHAIHKWLMYTLSIHNTWMLHCGTTKEDQMHVSVYNSMSSASFVFSSAEHLLCMHGCHVNCIINQWLHLTIRDTIWRAWWTLKCHHAGQYKGLHTRIAAMGKHVTWSTRTKILGPRTTNSLQ